MMESSGSRYGGLWAPGGPSEPPLRILVPSKLVSHIIGTGGATIREIIRVTGVRVDVQRKENVGIEKAITIYGSPESCSSACKSILQIMASTAKGEISLKIPAHNSLIGRIIGKGGATIKKIMQDTETKINVLNVSSVSEVSGLNMERVIRVRGSVEGMAAAEALISSKLRTYENDFQALTPGVVGMFPGLHPMAMMSTMAPTRQPVPSFGAPVPQAVTPPYQLGNDLQALAPGVVGMFPGLHPMAMMSTMAPTRQPVPSFGAPVPQAVTPPYQLGAPPAGLHQETVHMYIPCNSVGAVIGMFPLIVLYSHSIA